MSGPGSLTKKGELKVKANIEGPCCHRARLPVDQAELQKAKIKTSSRLFARLFSRRWAIRNTSTAVRATAKEATNSSICGAPPP